MDPHVIRVKVNGKDNKGQIIPVMEKGSSDHSGLISVLLRGDFVPSKVCGDIIDWQGREAAPGI